MLPETVREIVAQTLALGPDGVDALDYEQADAVLAALTEAGIVLCRRLQYAHSTRIDLVPLTADELGVKP